MMGAFLGLVGFLIVAGAVTVLPLDLLHAVVYWTLVCGIGGAVVWLYWTALSGEGDG